MGSGDSVGHRGIALSQPDRAAHAVLARDQEAGISGPGHGHPARVRPGSLVGAHSARTVGAILAAGAALYARVRRDQRASPRALACGGLRVHAVYDSLAVKAAS